MVLETHYTTIIRKNKNEIATARFKASIAANQHPLILYWKIGAFILQQQQAEGWCTKVIKKVSPDLRSEFLDKKGISTRNFKYMRGFAAAYPDFIIENPNKIPQIAKVQSPLTQIENKTIAQTLIWQLTCYQHITLINKFKDKKERIFYINKAGENGWSRNVLVHRIALGLYHSQGKAVNNFKHTLFSLQNDVAKKIMKGPYKFDVLSLYEEYKNKDREAALIKYITNFLLELGAGFSFEGKQYQLALSGADFYIDMLFYHLKLRCYIKIEQRIGKFIPEQAGKLQFYLNAGDDLKKHPTDRPTIGILICKEHNEVIAVYAFRDIHKPIGISFYDLTQSIPENLNGILPTTEQLEQEFAK